MNLVIAVLWTSGAILWALGGNPWLSALFAANAGIWFSLFVIEDL